jgi:hypothetical protein
VAEVELREDIAMEDIVTELTIKVDGDLNKTSEA